MDNVMQKNNNIYGYGLFWKVCYFFIQVEMSALMDGFVLDFKRNVP